MTKRSGKFVFSLCLMGALASCAHQENPVSSMPVSGDTATLVVPPLPVTEAAPAALPVAPAPKITKKGNRASRAAKPEVTVVASTDWQDHGPAVAEMPMPMLMAKAEPVMEAELKPVPQEAEVGIVAFLHRYLLLLISALSLGAVGLYAFFIYPNRKEANSRPNRFG